MERHWLFDEAHFAGTVLMALASAGVFQWLIAKQQSQQKSIEAREKAEQLDNKQMEILLERLDKAEHRGTKLEQQIDRLTGKIAALEIERNQLASRVAQLEHEKTLNVESIRNLNAKVTDLGNANEELTADQAAANEHIVQLTKIVEGLGQQPPPRPIKAAPAGRGKRKS